MNEILVSRNISKQFRQGAELLTILSDISLTVRAGEKIAIIGPSGSGKSTFLHLLGGLERPTTGSTQLFGYPWEQLSETQRCELRNKHLGFVYQFHHLLPEFTAFENIALPLLLAHQPIAVIEQKVSRLLEVVGLTARSHHKPSQLSGGERQRVAIARALIHSPAAVLADEPTGNLDTHTAQQVFAFLLELNQSLNTALVIVTHDLTLAKRMDRCLTLRGGHLLEQSH